MSLPNNLSNPERAGQARSTIVRGASAISRWCGLVLALAAVGCVEHDSDAAASGKHHNRTTPSHEEQVNAPEAAEDQLEPVSAEVEASEAQVKPEPTDDASRAPTEHVQAQPPEPFAHDTTPNDSNTMFAPTHDPDIRSDAPDERIHVVRDTALPPPSAGACAFEAPPNPAPEVDNANCPDGIVHGDVNVTSLDDVNQLRGCTRVTGTVRVKFIDAASLEGLEALRVIEGALYFEFQYFTPCSSAQTCRNANQKLQSLRGLDGLRCVGGNLGISPIGGPASPRPLDYSALRNLVEVGGYVNLQAPSSQSNTSLDSLRRVWGDLKTAITLDLPQLESVYGAFNYWHLGGPLPSDLYVGCSEGASYCRDGILGCSVVLNAQSELEQLSACEIALGEIRAAGVTSLSPLTKLREVRSGLTLDGVSNDTDSIQSLAGLESLKTCPSIRLAHMHQLVDLSALSGLSDLTAYPGWISLSDLPALQNLHGLHNIPVVSRLEITQCDALTDLSGLDSLREVSTAIIHENAHLETLNGVPNLRKVGAIYLQSNPALTDIAGLSLLDATQIDFSDLPALSTLEQLAGVGILRIHIQGLPLITDLHGLEGARENIDFVALLANAALQNVDALANIRTAGTLDIENNPALVSLQGLEGVARVTGAVFVTRYDSTDYTQNAIATNSSLPQCAAEALGQTLSIFASDNDPTGTCAP